MTRWKWKGFCCRHWPVYAQDDSSQPPREVQPALSGQACRCRNLLAGLLLDGRTTRFSERNGSTAVVTFVRTPVAPPCPTRPVGVGKSIVQTQTSEGDPQPIDKTSFLTPCSPFYLSSFFSDVFSFQSFDQFNSQPQPPCLIS